MVNRNGCKVNLGGLWMGAVWLTSRSLRLATCGKTIAFCKMIETQKHQQSFEALGLFQIDFGLMTLISEIFLSTEHKFGGKC